ncbi:conserved phage C-terminal domain-containing protein [Peptacetobacter sp. AB845]|uniref:conserved phage C-terminal domain-containing protein n=1 Tax=Peptacetobacter sp. AB845 TaxID=3388429 RepID=UPI0039C97B27
MEEEKLKNGFTSYLNDVLDADLTTTQKIVLLQIIRFYNKKLGYSFPSYEILADKSKITTRTAIKTVDFLVKNNWIKKEVYKGKGNKYFIPDKYMLVSSENNTCENNTCENNSLVGCNKFTSGVKNIHTTNTNINTNTITNNNMSDSKESDAPPGAFKDSINTNKKTNSSKKKTTKDYSNEIKEVVEYLNLKANRNYRPGTTKTKSLISARLKDYTVEDLKAVIDFKVGEWLENEKMNKYLRPETLFNETKFENYINELPSQATKESSQSYLEDNDVDLSIEDIIKINLRKSSNE